MQTKRNKTSPEKIGATLGESMGAVQPHIGGFRGKRIAVTGASGTLGRALLGQLHAQGAVLTALTSRSQSIEIETDGMETDQGTQAIATVTWKVGEESALADLLADIDILVLNHGVNVYGDRTPAAIEKSYEVNAFSSWRLLELFLTTVNEGNAQKKEVWVNTSEAESNPALSPLYELSKRTLGDLVTLRRLDAPCPIRKIILGPFKSELNPVGIMDGMQVARKVVAQAAKKRNNIIVTINPLTFVTFPLKEFFVSSYFRLFSKGS